MKYLDHLPDVLSFQKIHSLNMHKDFCFQEDGVDNLFAIVPINTAKNPETQKYSERWKEGRLSGTSGTEERHGGKFSGFSFCLIHFD